MKKNYLKVMLVLALCIATSGVNAQIIADGTYNIFNPNLSEVIGVNRIPEGDPGNPQNVIVGRARMQVYDVNNDDQEWAFVHQGNDIYKITNVGDNSILGVKDGWCGQFGDVQVGFDNTSPHTLFKVVAGSAANTFVFEIAFNNDCNFGSMNDPIKVFDIDGGNSGSKINTFDTDSGNANQEFQIVTLGTLNTDDRFLEDNLSIIYNRNEGLVINSNKKDLDRINVTIFDITGRSVISKELTNPHTTIKMETTNNSVFFARISDSNNNILVKKFIAF